MVIDRGIVICIMVHYTSVRRGRQNKGSIALNKVSETVRRKRVRVPKMTSAVT